MLTNIKECNTSSSSHAVASPSLWQCLTMHKCKNYCRGWIMGFTVLYCPPHTSDMAMSYFHLFPKPKEHLRAHHHMLDDETKAVVKLYSSIKMHNSNMRDLQSTWTLEKVCKPWRFIMWRNNCTEVNNKVQEGYLLWFHWNICNNGHIKNYEASVFSTLSYFIEIQKSWKQ